MKRTEFITFRTNEATKQALEKYAAEKKWTISFVVEQIVQEWVEHQNPSKDTSSDSFC